MRTESTSDVITNDATAINCYSRISDDGHVSLLNLTVLIFSTLKCVLCNFMTLAKNKSE